VNRPGVRWNTLAAAPLDSVSCASSAAPFRDSAMLGWSILFFLLALVAGYMGFMGLAGIAASIAQVLFVLFLVMLVISFVVRALQGRSVV
jgi:uncharacterized membrane protein YtjA (UPF0391 family)